jgi:DHA2 family multidrug resistance protein-like MFS transporter
MIGDAYIVANGLPGEQGLALIEAGKAPFSQTYTLLLMTAARVIAALAGIVFLTLTGHRRPSQAHH